VVAFAFGRAHAEGPPVLRTGLDVLAADGFLALKGKRVAVVANPTSVDRDLRPLVDLLAQTPDVKLVAIFALEHGFRGAAPAGVAVASGRDPVTGVPVHSLYGAVRQPTPAMLRNIDLVLFDVQDIGVRCYTYLSSLKGILTACSGRNPGDPRPEVWVLDRPSPFGSQHIGGPVLERGHESFVGPHATSLLHGLTPGEFARLVNVEAGLGARLRVVAMTGYHRRQTHADTDLVWIAPSPNIPTPGTALVYAGMVLVEGTNVSEGRGTTRPFRLFGAPWIDGRRLVSDLESLRLPGCRFRPLSFLPTTSKYDGKVCQGAELHVVNPSSFRPVLTAVAVLSAVRRLFPEDFAFRQKMFDRLAGTSRLRMAIESGTDPHEIVRSWEPELKAYETRREKFLLYR